MDYIVGDPIFKDGERRPCLILNGSGAVEKLSYHAEQAIAERDAEIARLRERIEELEGLLRRGMDINHDDPNSETLAWYAETVKTLEETADA